MKLFEIDDKIEALLNQGLDEETGEISEECLEELAALEEAKDSKCLAVAAYLRGEEAEANAVQAVIEGLKRRQERHKNRAAGLKNYLEMHADPGKNLSDARVEIKWRKSTPVDILDEKLLPKQYWRVKPAPKPEPNKVKIAADLKLGEKVPGARLLQRLNLTVK